MKYFLDTEFIEDGKTIDLISIGIVDEQGRELYLQNYDCDFTNASDWVWKNVIPHLQDWDFYKDNHPSTLNDLSTINFNGTSWRRHHDLKFEILKFIADDSKPQFIAYYADYDWIVFCQLFGTMMDLPKNFPMYCRDIKQWCDDLDNPKLPEQAKDEHHALADARWNKQAYEFLQSYKEIK